MRKPTAAQFFAGEIVGFAVLSVIAAVNSPGREWRAVTVSLLPMIAINIIGTAVTLLTGWTPWRDEP